jgi:hypothetical protein
MRAQPYIKTVITKQNTTQGTLTTLISVTFNLSDFHPVSTQHRMESATHYAMFLE